MSNRCHLSLLYIQWTFLPYRFVHAEPFKKGPVMVILLSTIGLQNITMEFSYQMLKYQLNITGPILRFRIINVPLPAALLISLHRIKYSLMLKHTWTIAAFCLFPNNSITISHTCHIYIYIYIRALISVRCLSALEAQKSELYIVCTIMVDTKLRVGDHPQQKMEKMTSKKRSERVQPPVRGRVKRQMFSGIIQKIFGFFTCRTK